MIYLLLKSHESIKDQVFNEPVTIFYREDLCYASIEGNTFNDSVTCMKVKMNYEEFEKELLEEYPTMTYGTARELYHLTYPNTVGDTTVSQTNQEVDKTMYEECIPCAPRVKTRSAIANAQVINAVPVEATQRDYTIERVRDIADKFDTALRVQFHMDSEMPKTFLQLVDAIKNGNYRVDEDKINAYDAQYMGWHWGVTWGLKPDYVGYEAAKKVLKTATQKALDAATLKTPDALQGVIDDFEAWTLPTAD